MLPISPLPITMCAKLLWRVLALATMLVVHAHAAQFNFKVGIVVGSDGLCSGRLLIFVYLIHKTTNIIHRIARFVTKEHSQVAFRHCNNK
jgi:hypothetical protein